MKLEALDSFRQPMRPHLREILDECAEAGELARGLDTWTVYNVIWTSMHGIASQYVCDRFPPSIQTNTHRSWSISSPPG